jgi:hypothetical protein
MSARGWLLNTAGFWIERARGSARERLDRTRQSGDLSEPVITHVLTMRGLHPARRGAVWRDEAIFETRSPASCAGKESLKCN